MRVRKRPVTVDAFKYEGDWQPLMEWLDELNGSRVGIPSGHWRAIARNDDGTLTIETLEGAHTGQVGDYVICGVAGEFYPCKPDIFEQTYEAVGDGESTADAVDEEEPDLSGYTVTFTKGDLGWGWEVKTPDGEILTDGFGRVSVRQENAERHAFHAIERHAAQPAPVTGEELRQRVESRDPTAEPEAER